ncbi:MAG: preprotein translocase subunit SecG [Candidatus Omnitrophota bacterium]|nr:preprotein translocase subunit SecG [Candidatus Omnitrophota bacterium]
MLGLAIVLHILISILLITVILMQSGRGGGLTEGLAAGAESIFGSKTNAFMVRATTGLAIAFLITCLGLAFLSTQRSKSLMERRPAQKDAPAAAVVPAANVVVNKEISLPSPKEEPKNENTVPAPVNQTTK